MSFLGIAAPAVVGAISGFLNQSSKNKATAQANAQMIEWERERAKNAHQWEVEDLRKAGLNPILSAGGSGANTSGVSIIPAGESPFASGINSALSTASAIKSIEGIELNNRKMEADADIQNYIRKAYKDASTDNFGGYFDKDGNFVVKPTNWIAEKLKSDAITSAKSADLVERQIEALDADIARKEAFASMYKTDAGKYIAMLETLVPLIGSALNPLAFFGGSVLRKPAQITSKTYHSERGTNRHTEIYNGKDWLK